MLSQSLKLFMLILVIAALLISLNSRTRELIDRLPEVQYAKAYVRVANLLIAAFRQDCEADVSAINEIEPLLLYDMNGNARDDESLSQMARQLFCAVHTIGVETETDSTADAVSLYYRLASGEPIRLSETVVLDGTKQSIRAYASFILPLPLNQTLISKTSSERLGDEPCETVRGWVQNGKTFEVRQAAFGGLHKKNSLEESSNPRMISSLRGLQSPDCVEHRDGAEESLMEAAKAGDLDSALQLALLWDRAEAKGLLQARIDHFEQLVLANTGRNPYLVHAAILQLIGLYSAKFQEQRKSK